MAMGNTRRRQSIVAHFNRRLTDARGDFLRDATGHEEPRKFPSGPTLKAEQMVARALELAGDW
jgi:hypothetical protein